MNICISQKEMLFIFILLQPQKVTRIAIYFTNPPLISPKILTMDWVTSSIS